MIRKMPAGSKRIAGSKRPAGSKRIAGSKMPSGSKRIAGSSGGGGMVTDMRFKLACCQMEGSLAADMEENKRETADKAESMIREAAANGCDIAVLPEMWNTPYSNEYFREYAEDAGGRTAGYLSGLAAELGIYIVGGSIPETEDGNVYNTSFVFDRKGNIIARHRKAHLFDVDIKGGIRFMESDTLTPGDEVTVFDTEFGKIGLAICFDVRFPELFRKMALEGAQLIILPAAFNMTTGPVHWELSMKMRALDNQLFMAAVSPARNEKGVYTAYGHSMIVDPWADILAEAGSGEEIIYAVIDTDRIKSVRDQLPLLKARRPELY